MDLIGLQVGQACTYRVSTPCGYPRLNITFSNAHPSDYDVFYGFGQWNDSGDFNATLYQKSWFQDSDR